MRRSKHRLASTAAQLMVPLTSRKSARGRRVLMFHGVDDPIIDADPDLYNHTWSQFQDHIHTIRSWAIPRRIGFLPFDGSVAPGITITFDDGYASIATAIAPMLVEYGIPFHVFVPVGLVNETRQLQLSTNDIRTLSTNSLIGFGAHGLMHRSLTSLNDDELRHELSTSRSVLSDLTGREVQSMSYPFGDHDGRVRNAARHAGFTVACTSSPGTHNEMIDPMQIPRIDIWAMDSPRDVLNKLRGAWDWLL